MLSLAHASLPTARLAPARSRRGRGPARAATRARASDDGKSAVVEGDAESREVLDAFFVGKALAAALLERAGGAFADALSDIARFDADTRDEMRKFQDEVMAKAREDMARSKPRDDGMR